MLPRERVLRALDFKAPGTIPVEYHASPAGSYEHGAKLHELWARYPEDFGDSRRFPRSAPDPRWIDAGGRYEEVRRDEWSVLWKYLIYGVAGHPLERPLDDWSNLDRYTLPEAPARSGEAFEREKARAAAHRHEWFLKSGWVGIFEVLCAVRRFEDVLMEIGTDEPEINRLADKIVEYHEARIAYWLERGIDAVQFGDDFGTQWALMLSPQTWRRFFRPRFERLMAPVHQAGKKVFFHLCGHNAGILDDLAGMGVHAIWPQLNAYPQGWLAKWSRDAKVAVAVHPDRGDLMARATPDDVRAAVGALSEEFQLAEGGGWFYIEIDSGFPWANVEALIGEVGRLRGL
jgi:hypothetical protein